jgi:hypothetical protein
MNQQPDLATLFVYVMFSLIEAVAPILLLIVFIWLAVKAISFLVYVAFSPDGGLSRREQLHQHRLENLAACLTFAAFITGGVMLLYGDPSGTFKITFPGGIVMENVGVPVIFLGFASSILWMLLKAKAPKVANVSAPLQAHSSDQNAGEQVEPHAARMGELLQGRHPAVTQDHGAQVVRWFQNMTYAKAGVITLVLLPLIQVVAIPVGIFLFWMASRRDNTG